MRYYVVLILYLYYLQAWRKVMGFFYNINSAVTARERKVAGDRISCTQVSSEGPVSQ
jgi:hypothetical protein